MYWNHASILLVPDYSARREVWLFWGGGGGHTCCYDQFKVGGFFPLFLFAFFI